MEELDLFKWLIQYHYEKNLKPLLPHIHDGVNTEDITGREGYENESRKGFMIIANGGSLLERMIADSLVKREDVDIPFTLGDKENFFRHLDEEHGRDGAYVVDRKRNEIRRVYKIYDKPESLLKKLASYSLKMLNPLLRPFGLEIAENKVKLEDKIPKDFVFYDGKEREKPLRAHIGTKTRRAMELTDDYNDVEAFLIKRSRYTPLGFGKVTHFTRDGLTKEFFFMYNPDSKGPFIDEERKIVGVYRRYERSNGELIKVVERIVSLSEIYGHFSASNGKPHVLQAIPPYRR